jgi:hypothetical protein
MQMIWINHGSVCPSSGYLISETEKEIIKLALETVKGDLKAHSLTKKESVLDELI